MKHDITDDALLRNQLTVYRLLRIQEVHAVLGNRIGMSTCNDKQAHSLDVDIICLHYVSGIIEIQFV